MFSLRRSSREPVPDETAAKATLAEMEKLRSRVAELEVEVTRLNEELEVVRAKEAVAKAAADEVANPKTPEAWFRKAVRSFPDFTTPTLEDFQQFDSFGLQDDTLLAVRPGSVAQTFTHYGRLYLSTRHVSFNGWMKKFVVPLETITDVRFGEQSDRVTLVFGSPLQVHGMSFGSFKQPMPSIELQSEQTVAVVLSLYVRRFGKERRESLPDDEQHLAALDSDSDMCLSDQDDEPAPTQVVRDGVQLHCRCDSKKTFTQAAADLRKSCQEVADEPAFGSAAKAKELFLDDGASPFKDIFEAQMPDVSTELIAEQFLACEWGPDMLWVKFALKGGSQDINVSPPGDDGSETNTDLVISQVREIKMSIDMKGAPMCPPRSAFTQILRVTVGRVVKGDKPYILIESSNMVHDVPFGQNFYVQERVHVTPSDQGAHFRKEVRHVFIKSVGMLKGIMVKGSIRGCIDGAADLVKMLHEEGTLPRHDAGAGATFKSSNSAQSQGRNRSNTALSQATFRVDVWELERRSGVLTLDWRTPYLPNDGNRAWRWVDRSYKRHPWTSVTKRADAAEAKAPPIEPGAGWDASSDWHVETSDTTDAEGWQYSRIFNKFNSTWGLQSYGCTVRRRLWARTYVETKPE